MNDIDSCSVTFESDDPAYSGEMRIAWILEPVEEGTRVTVRCEGVPVGISPEDHQAGLRSTLSNLATFAEHGALSMSAVSIKEVTL